MHICEERTQLTLINLAIKEYKLERGLLRPISKYWFLYNPILKLIQHPTIERINYTLVSYVYYNEIQEPRPMTYYPLYVGSL